MCFSRIDQFSSFKEQQSFEERQRLVQKGRKKYPHHVPLGCERGTSSRLPDLPLKTFQIEESLTVGHFLMSIRQRLHLSLNESIFLLVNNTIPPVTTTMGELYRDYREEDGFVYVVYVEESVYGLIV